MLATPDGIPFHVVEPLPPGVIAGKLVDKWRVNFPYLTAIVAGAVSLFCVAGGFASLVFALSYFLAFSLVAIGIACAIVVLQLSWITVLFNKKEHTLHTEISSFLPCSTCIGTSALLELGTVHFLDLSLPYVKLTQDPKTQGVASAELILSVTEFQKVIVIAESKREGDLVVLQRLWCNYVRTLISNARWDREELADCDDEVSSPTADIETTKIECVPM